jgi:F-type H+-transporting ATPase subunit c
MKKRFALFVLLALAVMLFCPTLFAAAAPAGQTVDLKTSNPEVAKWAVIIAGIAMTIASSVGALAQAIAVRQACKGIARNPAATKDIRGALIIGLVLIESLILYTLVVVFVKL